MKRWHIAAGAGACLLLGTALGRWTARQPDVELQEHAAEQARVQVVEVVMDRTEWVTRRDEATDTHRVRVVYRERLPDGTERSLEREETGTQAKATTETTGHHEATQARAEVRTVTRTVDRVVKVHDPVPDWRASALLGWDGAPVYGGMVERRVLGPISVGGWAAHGAGWMGGVSVGVGW